MSTILKWAGNKTAVMPELTKHLPTGPRLVEPFAGSCAVMMATEYPQYLIADINPDLISFYQAVAGNPFDLMERAKHLFKIFNSEHGYYDSRESFNHNDDPEWRAALFLYLNRHCYRGLCRYNKKGQFNTPYGNYKNPYFPEKEIIAFAEKAKRATFICASYDETLAQLQTGDVVYCDPPYDGLFSSYHTDGFTEDDQHHLASTLELRASEGHQVVVSNSDTPLTRTLYRSFIRHRITVKRSIAVAAGSSKSAAEIIAVSKQPDQPSWSGFDPAVSRDYSVTQFFPFLNGEWV